MIGFIEGYEFTTDGFIIKNGEYINPVNGRVTLQLSDRDITDLAARFFVIARTRMLRLEDLDKIQVFYNDDNENNFEITNLEYFFAPALKCHIHRGFYVIPKATCYAIDESGKLINRMNGKEKVWTITKPNPKKNITGGYRTTKCAGDSSPARLVSRHRSLLLTFNPPKTNPAFLWVNHKDGIPGNDDLTNLEWVTPGENNKHAYRTGLTTRPLAPVVVRDIVTGEVSSFLSTQLCAENYGLTHNTLTSRLSKPEIAFEGKQFKRDDGSDWPELVRSSNGKSAKLRIACRDIITGEIQVFETAEQASAATGHDPYVIGKHAKAMRIKPLSKYNFRLVNQESWFPNHHPNSVQTYLRYPLHTPSGVISEDNEIYFNSLSELAVHYGLKEDTVYASFIAGRLIGGLKWKRFNHEANLGEPIYLENLFHGPL